MLRQAWRFVCNHGHAIMVLALIAIGAGGIVLFKAPHEARLAWTIVIVAIAVYALGRAGVLFGGKTKPPPPNDSGSDQTL